MRSIRRLFSKPAAPPERPFLAFNGTLPSPDAPFAVIGDIHGRADLLQQLWTRLSQTVPGVQIVHVGDYIDRGESSAEVIDLLFCRQSEVSDIVCLAGNHEQMFLDFLDRPEEYGGKWLRHGGLQTVASFGIQNVRTLSNARQYEELAAMLRDKLGAAKVNWLRNLPTRWFSGNLAVVHAGADPGQPIEKQPDRNLIWGHRDFRERPRQDGLWVVHGHTIVDVPLMQNGVISLDTGAYATNRLTSAIFRPDCDVEFVQVMTP